MNWYPRIQTIEEADGGASLNTEKLSKAHIAFMDLDRIYFEMERFKSERGWHNLILRREEIVELLHDPTWYTLYIPREEMAHDSFENVRVWEEIVLSLLKKYAERLYTFKRQAWEKPHLVYQELTVADANFPEGNEEHPEGYYRILIDESREEIVTKLGELKALIENGSMRSMEFHDIKALGFDRHLYEPLFQVIDGIIDISPAPLNHGEMRFVDNLKAFYDGNSEFFEGRDMYLLRNMSRGRGVGFFQAGNFHPDFVLWLVDSDHQYISFVDPKGLRNVRLDDDKIEFYKTIKGIEAELDDPAVTLNSFIISNTEFNQMESLWNLDMAEMRRRHVLFRDVHAKGKHIRVMFELATAPPSSLQD